MTGGAQGTTLAWSQKLVGVPVTDPLPKPWTVDDFLAWERRQPERYEFFGGVIRMMVGGSNAHTILKGNIFAALRARLHGGRCRAMAEGSKVVTTSATMYPDAIVVCGPIDLAEDQVRAPTWWSRYCPARRRTTTAAPSG
jgi:Uma2 family endonuclease